MPTKANDAETVALADTLLRALASLRQQGGQAYPPKLRQLAGLAGGSPPDELVQKAAAKTAFTAKAIVIAKVDRKPSLDSPVYFKEDVPAKERAPSRAPARKSKDDGAELAGRMLLVLEAQRRLGAEAYPPALRRLAELCNLNASDTRVIKAASHMAITDHAVVAAKAKGKPSLDAPVILRGDFESGVTAVLPAILRFALAPLRSTGKGKSTETTAFTPSEVHNRLVPELRAPIASALARGIERRDLPDDIAWIVTKGKPYVFLVDNIRGSMAQESCPIGGSPPAPSRAAVVTPGDPARPARDFASAFREAFERLDRRNGATNFVKLAELRHALHGISRAEFDAGLRAIRQNGEFSLDSHEGLHGSLTAEEREAGVHEAGSLLVYVSRR